MSIFKRLFSIAKSEVNSLIDNLEDPIKCTEQGIKELKLNLNHTLEARANLEVRLKRITEQQERLEQQAENYEKEAINLLTKAKNKELTENNAEKLAAQAIAQKNEFLKKINEQKSFKLKLENEIIKLNEQINFLKKSVTNWQAELNMITVNSKINTVQKNLNKQMAEIDDSGTISLLERMKKKAENEAALAEAYKNIIDINSIEENQTALSEKSTQKTINKEIEELKKTIK